MVDDRSSPKSHIPLTPGAIERPRLLRALKSVLDHKLTLVSAPPGYGKTTIVSQFAHQTSHTVAWHLVEERERDVPNLYAHALDALAQVADSAPPLPDAQAYTPGELAAFVADAIRDTAPGTLIYVLDDVQHLAGSAAAEMWLRMLVGLLPLNCHLVLISRVLPRLPYAEMIARGEMLAIGQEELRLTVDEAQTLSGRMLVEGPTRPEVRSLVEDLEGWPAGIVLALQPLPANLERAMLGGSRGPEALFDALAASMLSVQPADLRDFLLASSTLSHLTPALCEAALGLPGSGQMLAEAQVRNLFLSKVAGGLVYHALFRTFLQEQLRAHAPARFNQLHTRAGEWFEAEGTVEEAFTHYMTAGLSVRAAALAERVAAAYYAQGKTETLLTWSERLERLNELAPRLLLTCARVHIDRYEYDEARRKLALAEKGFVARSDEVGQADVELQRSMINIQIGNFQEAASQAERLMTCVPNVANLRGRAMRNLGLALIRLGDVEGGLDYLERALPLYRADGDLSALSHLLQDLGLAYTRLGSLDEAGASLQEQVALRRALGSAGPLALALNNLGYYYHQRSDYAQAEATYREGLSVVARVSDRRAESYLLWSMGDLQRDLGDHEQALRLYTRALELHGNSERILRVSLLISMATLRRWQGRHTDATSLARQAAQVAQEAETAPEKAMARANAAASLAEMGDPEGGLVEVGAAIRDLGALGLRYELTGVLGVQARVALLAGDEARAAESLDDALRLAETVGSAQPLAAEMAHTPSLESFAATREPRYGALLRELALLREAQQRPADRAQVTTLPLADTVYSLRVSTLGQERIERDGQPLTAADWRATAARDLFLYLLFHGAQSRERISLTFWPDSSTKRVRSNFHTTLYRARQALGEEAILFLNDRYLINPEIDLWCDAHTMIELAEEARLLPARDARAEDLWRKAVALYQGDFLPTVEADWAYAMADQYQELYLEALAGLSECARARNDFREAIGTLHRALEIDPYREDTHRAIMICYAQMGEKHQVRVHLNKLEMLLLTDLGINPSEETLGLATVLLS